MVEWSEKGRNEVLRSVVVADRYRRWEGFRRSCRSEGRWDRNERM
jgi:hypothetical protein